MFDIFLISSLVCWFTAVSIIAVTHYLLYGDVVSDKFSVETYYYKSNGFTEGSTDNRALMEQWLDNDKHVWKQLTDIGWIIYVGFTIPFMVFIIMLPLYIQRHISIYLLLPLLLWLLNSFLVYYRKKFNKYDEYEELKSPYNHRYVPLILTYNIFICSILFLVIICTLLTPASLEMPFIIGFILLAALDVLLVYIDKANNHLKHDLRSNLYFGKFILITAFILLLFIMAILGYYVSIFGFDITFQTYVNNHSMQQISGNRFI